MSRLVESLLLKDGALVNVEYHNMRMRSSRRDLFQIDIYTNLQEEIAIPENFKSGIFKCRVLYSENIEFVEFIPYIKKQVRSLKIVSGEIDYTYKFEDRTAIAELFTKRSGCDDILIAKNNLITDTSSANIVLLRDGKWRTPSAPLLKGTRRQKLIDEGIIFEEEIAINEIKHYGKASLINAMLEIEDVLIEIENIL